METIKYITSLLTFYLKGQIKSDQNFIIFKNPNTILGLIPLGSKTDKYPINQISSVSTNFKMKFLKLVLGIIAIVLAFTMLSEPDEGAIFGMIVFLIIGINWIIDAFEVDLTVTTTSGQEKIIDFFIFEKGKAVLAEKRINELITGRLSDTNVRQQTDRVVDAINNK